MITGAADDWMTLLSRLSMLLLRSDDLKGELTEKMLATAWCGQAAAAEGEIFGAEMRLGITLPPSYRSFLSISNGWRPFNSFIERLLSIEEVERFRTADPARLSSLQQCYREDDITDDDYLDYETATHMESMRLRYYPDSLLIGKGWGVEDDMVLLNPNVVLQNGEWEAIVFANWIPGNRRFRSFVEFVSESVSRMERSER